ncbi:DUF6082 family protein [Dactylosporangium matsuzakiense]|uniref:Uncharacterized protein n=1 Tax=Dactylosporangium matsuzakiense TaxID=53360 RepID=A0A9W6NKW4_9ACTN|nr:DUF6082 family protein [Dactylosporangium matsuzakiense]UWZ46126.1 hypothetical protein Dmats_06640 [Dactylosporangium matsuzakiense]GLL00267.1 hypothetical protein GCM10017581_020070 [Dactylosporangium matsuzakiense]
MSRVFRIIGAIIGSLFVLLLLIEVPYLFSLIGGTTDAWNRLSLIGQAYGSVSAIISAIALAGVVVSLVVQRQQTRIAAQYSFRQQHFAVYRAALDDPALMECIGSNQDLDISKRRQLIYINLISTFWYSAWHVGDLRDAELSSNLKSEIFSTEIGRLWWQRAREFRAAAHDQTLSRFDQLIEAAYQEVIASLVAAAAPQSAAGERA